MSKGTASAPERKSAASKWAVAAVIALLLLGGFLGSGGQEPKRPAAAGRIEPELRALLPGGGTGYGSDYFAGKTYWYWLKLSPGDPVQYNFTIMADLYTERFPDVGERIHFSKTVSPRSLVWSGSSFTFAEADPAFARYSCPPGTSPAQTTAAQAWKVQGTVSEDGRKLVSLKISQGTKTCDVRVVREGYREIRRGGETVRERDHRHDVTEVYVRKTDLACEFRDLPLRKPDPIIIGPQRGVILDFGADSAAFKKHLTRCEPAAARGSIAVHFNVREEPQTGVAGRVTARNTKPAEALPDDNRPRHPLSFPIPEATVSLLKDGKLLASRAARADGTYFIPFKGPADKLAVRVELRHGAATPSAFKVVHDKQDDPVSVVTEEFSLPASSPSPVEVDVEWSDESGVKPSGAGKEKLYDLALIYHYTHQAWKLIAGKLAGSVPSLAFNPSLVVRAFSTNPTAVSQDAYGDMTKPELALTEKRSRAAVELRPGTIWHELGHVVHGVMAAHQFFPVWENPAWKGYHDGYANPDTWASYIEGFAHFFAGLVATHVAGGLPGVIDVNGFARNLSLAENMPWSLQGELEEFAAAALLWDLADDDVNSTRLETTRRTLDDIKLDFDPPFAGDTAAKEYRDNVRLEPGELIRLMAAPTENDQPLFASGAGPAPPWDVRQLYSVLKAAGHGSRPSAAHTGLDALDEVFIAHGFFADAAPQNLVHDPGEEIGYSANGGAMEFFWPDPNGERRVLKRFAPRFDPKRRIPPPPPDSRLAYRVTDASGASLDVRDFEIEVAFDGPNSAYDYTARVFTAEPGLLPVICADPAVPSTTRIRPLLKGGRANADLVITGEEYWAAVGRAGSAPFKEHTFIVSADAAAASAGDTNLAGWIPSAPPAGGPSQKATGTEAGVVLLVLLAAGIAILAAAVVIIARRRKKG